MQSAVVDDVIREAPEKRGNGLRSRWWHPRLRSPWLAVVVVGALAHWPLLRLRGTYWDDWMLVRSSDLEQFRLTGRIEFAYVHHVVLRADDPIQLARWLQFGLWIAAAVLLLACLRRLPMIPARLALTAACLFAALPTYSARVTQIMLPSTLAFVVFLCFWLLLLRTPPEQLSTGRGSALLAGAVVAYSLQSLLIFIAVPLGTWVWSHGGPRAVWRSARSRSALVALAVSPLVYYAIRATLLSPSGVFAGYNAVSPWAALLATAMFVLSTPELASDIFIDGLTVSAGAVVVAAAFAMVVLWPPMRSASTGATRSVPLTGRAAVFGLACLGAAILPYVLVGKAPTQSDWDSRHQMLLSIGLAVLLAYAVHRILGERPHALHVVTGLVLGMMIVGNWATYGEFAVDTARQAALQDALRDQEGLRRSRLIALELDHDLVGARRRELRYYEASHLVRDALGITRQDLLVLFSDPANWSRTYQMQLRAPTPFPIDFMGLERVDVSEPSACSWVFVDTQRRAHVTARRLPELLIDGVDEVPDFSVRDVRHGCRSEGVRRVLSPG